MSRPNDLEKALANLGYKLREELRSKLKLIFARKGGAIVYATPEPIDAMRMAYQFDLLLAMDFPTMTMCESYCNTSLNFG